MNPIQDLKQIIATVMESDPEESIEDAANLVNDLGMASIDFIELVVAIEKQFGIRVPIEALSDTTTVATLADWIVQHAAQAEPVSVGS